MLQTGFIGGRIGYRLLRWLGQPESDQGHCDGKAYRARSKLEVLFGPEIWSQLAGKVVIDFGCGTGREAIEMARQGARRVIGIDIRPKVLDAATAAAREAGVSDRCLFATHTAERADLIISMDGFEHYDDPDGVLRTMRGLIKDEGRGLISFGPPWFHPYGGHLFSVFPWAHLIFTEKALIRWRSDFKSDGATRFHEVEGGLNGMTIRRFEELVVRSDFNCEALEAVPIRKLRPFQSPVTREFTTSVVRCRLVPIRSTSRSGRPQFRAIDGRGGGSS